MKKHLKFIDSLPCVVCGIYGQSTHHHILRVAREYLTPTRETEGLMFPKFKEKAMGTKSDDRFCLPVCAKCHADAHLYGNDREFFRRHGLDRPEEFALMLWEKSGNFAGAMDLFKWRFLGVKRCSEWQNLKK